MKRHRQANRTSAAPTGRTGSVCLHASSVWAKSAGATPQNFPAAPGSEGQALTRYIDSRLKQFGCR